MLSILATEFLLPNKTTSSSVFHNKASLQSLPLPNNDKINNNDALLLQQKIKLPRKVQSYLPTNSKNNKNRNNTPIIHDPMQLRNCLALTATPNEFQKLRRVVSRILLHAPYTIFDCIHLTLSDHFLRVDQQQPEQEQQQQQNSSSSSSSTTKLLDFDKLRSMFTNERIILHRITQDYGPMTRYVRGVSTRFPIYTHKKIAFLYRSNHSRAFFFFFFRKTIDISVHCHLKRIPTRELSFLISTRLALRAAATTTTRTTGSI
jgi:hypothetical protein